MGEVNETSSPPPLPVNDGETPDQGLQSSHFKIPIQHGPTTQVKVKKLTQKVVL